MASGPWAVRGGIAAFACARAGAACFVSLFGTAPDDLPYRMGTAVDAAVEVSIFQGRGGPMVSCHCCAMRPAGLGNAPAEQAARFDAFLSGTAPAR